MTDAGVREVTDSRVLAAMSHPLRRRLMDVLKVYGPATVSALAGQTGQAVANISHHLRVLGAAGLILEAPELARDRREHWWRLAAPALRWAAGAFDDDPARQAVASAAVSLSLDRQVSLARAWYAVREERPAWNGAAFSVDKWLHLTPAGHRRAGAGDPRGTRPVGATEPARRRGGPRAGLRVCPRHAGAAVTATGSAPASAPGTRRQAGRPVLAPRFPAAVDRPDHQQAGQRRDQRGPAAGRGRPA